MNGTARKIIDRFDAAATRYDRHAGLQAQVAKRLVDWASPPMPPRDVLDIGSGTGFVAENIARRWPDAHITALDRSPAMLREARAKLPRLAVIAGDAAGLDPGRRFDAIFSSMMLHWLPDPRAILKRWQGWLKPQGRLYVALLTEGSFREWRELCRAGDVADGLWPMPEENFADSLAVRTLKQPIEMTYPSAHDFLRRLKATGAATARADHTPVTAAAMRRLLRHAPRPFAVTYQTLYIETPPQGGPRNTV